MNVIIFYNKNNIYENIKLKLIPTFEMKNKNWITYHRFSIKIYFTKNKYIYIVDIQYLIYLLRIKFYRDPMEINKLLDKYPEIKLLIDLKKI